MFRVLSRGSFFFFEDVFGSKEAFEVSVAFTVYVITIWPLHESELFVMQGHFSRSLKGSIV